MWAAGTSPPTSPPPNSSRGFPFHFLPGWEGGGQRSLWGQALKNHFLCGWGEGEQLEDVYGGPCVRRAEKPSGRVTALQGALRVGNHRGRRRKDFRPLQRSSEQILHCRSQPAGCQEGDGIGRGKDTWKGLPALAAPPLSRENPQPPAQPGPPDPFEQGARGWERGREGPARA